MPKRDLDLGDIYSLTVKWGFRAAIVIIVTLSAVIGGMLLSSCSRGA